MTKLEALALLKKAADKQVPLTELEKAKLPEAIKVASTFGFKKETV